MRQQPVPAGRADEEEERGGAPSRRFLPDGRKAEQEGENRDHPVEKGFQGDEQAVGESADENRVDRRIGRRAGPTGRCRELERRRDLRVGGQRERWPLSRQPVPSLRAGEP